MELGVQWREARTSKVWVRTDSQDSSIVHERPRFKLRLFGLLTEIVQEALPSCLSIRYIAGLDSGNALFADFGIRTSVDPQPEHSA